MGTLFDLIILDTIHYDRSITGSISADGILSENRYVLEHGLQYVHLVLRMKGAVYCLLHSLLIVEHGKSSRTLVLQPNGGVIEERSYMESRWSTDRVQSYQRVFAVWKCESFGVCILSSTEYSNERTPGMATKAQVYTDYLQVLLTLDTGSGSHC